MTLQDQTVLRASDSFQKASCVAQPLTSRKKPPSPFSIRLSEDERAYLIQQAGSRPLGAYIRSRLLGDRAEKRRTFRKPKIDDKQIAQVLAALGASRLSSNLNHLAKSANMGTLDVSRNVEQELEDACGAVLAMRDALLMALGLKTDTNEKSSANASED
ncbi:MAG: hypothetical protein LJE91_01515 [Gammaproteobacteria bacterium]|jgi:hypothetical protein|nr:hypothetical protein [Gammaproteobacteria bacterium]